MGQQELANAIFGGKRAETSTEPTGKTTTSFGTATTGSADGVVTVVPDGDITSQDGTNAIEYQTHVAVQSGDRVAITSVDGSPTVTGVVGGGDRTQVDIINLFAATSETQTLIREYASGVLVAKVGQSVGALVNANGSYDVVTLTWDGSNPTVGTTLMSMDSDSVDYANGLSITTETSEILSDSVIRIGGDGNVALECSGTALLDGRFVLLKCINDTSYIKLDASKSTEIENPIRLTGDTSITGALTVTQAATTRTNLGLGAAALLGTPIPVAYGGTGATTVSAARSNLGLNDSGWIWLNGPYGTENQGVKYRSKYGICYVYANMGSDSAISITSSGWTAGTLASAYRPAFNIISAADGKGNNLGQIAVMSDGTVKLWLFGGSSVYFAGFVTYPL